MKNIAILGCTGSIGTQALDVVRQQPETGRICALSAKSNAELVLKQAIEFKPALVAVEDEAAARGCLRE